MFKRIGLFLITNLVIMFTISIITSVLGVNRFLSANGINYPMLMAYCFIWGMAGSFISLLMSRFIAKMSMGVKVVDQNNPGQYSGLVQSIGNICRSAQIPMPEIGIYDSPDVNAFATGASKNKSLVAVSTGLLSTMSKQELDGVLAHEVAHIKNGDMVTLTLVQGVVNSFVMFFAYVISFAIQNVLRKNDDEREGSFFGGGIAFHLTYMLTQMVLGFLGMMVVGYFSRYREFHADAGSAKIVGSNAMIAALEKLKSLQGHLPKVEEPEAIAAFKISSNTSSFLNLLMTHPPLETRIEALKKNTYSA